MHALTVIATGVATALLSLSAVAHVNCAPGAPGVIPLPVQVGNVTNSRSNPQINQRHIFCGEINGGGNAVGFHSRPANHDPLLGPLPTAHIAAHTIGPRTYIVPHGLNHPGDYRYVNPNVQVFNTVANAWVAKVGASTFFPDSCSQRQVVESIRYAYMHLNTRLTPLPAPPAPPVGGQMFFGPSAPPVNAAAYCVDELGFPFTVGGYLNNIGGLWWVNSVYPVAAF